MYERIKTEHSYKYTTKRRKQ